MGRDARLQSSIDLSDPGWTVGLRQEEGPGCLLQSTGPEPGFPLVKSARPERDHARGRSHSRGGHRHRVPG